MAADFLVQMGERLRQRRDEMGLSRPELARRMPGKVSENQIYRWEKGQHMPNLDTLEALARLLERPVGYFMGPEPDKTETPDLATAMSGEADGVEDLAGIREQLQALDARLDQMIDKLGEPAAADQLAAIEERLAEKIDALNAKNEARAAEARRQIEQALEPIRESLRRRQA